MVFKESILSEATASSETSCPTGSGGEVNTKTSKLLVE